MKFVHTFWSKPFLSNKFNNKNTNIPVILSDYAYSVACIKKYEGHTIRLFTDKFGAEMLGWLPYDEIIVLDNLDNENVHFAAQIKFHALKQMELDECIMDGDLFLRNNCAINHIETLKPDCLYSFYEPQTYVLRRKDNYFAIIKEKLVKHNDEFDDLYKINETDIFEWPNTSLLKFNNNKIKDLYIEQYFKNKKILENEEYGEVWPDIWIEQKNLEKLINSTGCSCAPAVYGFPANAAEMYAVMIGYCHLGADKINIKDTVFEWLRKTNEDLYNETLAHINKLQKLFENEQ